MGADNFFYFNQKSTVDQENEIIPSNDLVLQMIEYAKELEIIV